MKGQRAFGIMGKISRSERGQGENQNERVIDPVRGVKEREKERERERERERE